MPARRMERFIQGPVLQKANPLDGPLKTPSRQPQRIVERIPPSPQSSVFSSRSSISTISTIDSIRSVTFLEPSMNHAQEVPPLSEEEVAKTWWTKEDIEQFQVTADSLVKSLQKRPNMAASSSSSSSSKSSPSTYTEVLNRIYDQCCSKSGDANQDDCEELIKWQRNSHGRRGLESKILATMNEDRAYRKEAVVHAVLTLQGNDTIDPVIKAESIRRCSERMTQPARSFARVIALADEGCQKPIEKRPRIRVAARTTTRMTIM